MRSECVFLLLGRRGVFFRIGGRSGFGLAIPDVDFNTATSMEQDLGKDFSSLGVCIVLSFRI